MALPDRVQVRLSSEAAGAISLTQVISQAMPLRELVEVILSATGKDPFRVSEILRRGAVVQGASRYRWEPLKFDTADLNTVLATFPDADPERAFCPEACTGARLRSRRQVIELPRETASKRRLLKRQSFWDILLALASTPDLEYSQYSYRLRADEYRLPVTPARSAQLRAAANLLSYSTVSSQVAEGAFESIEYLVHFP